MIFHFSLSSCLVCFVLVNSMFLGGTKALPPEGSTPMDVDDGRARNGGVDADVQAAEALRGAGGGAENGMGVNDGGSAMDVRYNIHVFRALHFLRRFILCRYH